eukprot:15472743-Alexandrium_andersonii.AAC.1
MPPPYADLDADPHPDHPEGPSASPDANPLSALYSCSGHSSSYPPSRTPFLLPISLSPPLSFAPAMDIMLLHRPRALERGVAKIATSPGK